VIDPVQKRIREVHFLDLCVFLDTGGRFEADVAEADTKLGRCVDDVELDVAACVSSRHGDRMRKIVDVDDLVWQPTGADPRLDIFHAFAHIQWRLPKRKPETAWCIDVKAMGCHGELNMTHHVQAEVQDDLVPTCKSNARKSIKRLVVESTKSEELSRTVHELNESLR
jgi:hypothetical protein